MKLQPIQIAVFLGLTALIALVTYLYCRGKRSSNDEGQEYFLAGKDLKWYFVAGSITLTNLSTDQLVGMNGNQMGLLVWWELAAVAGLLMLTFLFIPVYYRYNCTTTTELLEKRYNNLHIRALISVLFLAGNIFILLPGVLYGGSLFMQQMFGLEFLNIYYIAIAFALVGSAYAIFGGLRAVAVSDTFSGILLLSLALFVLWRALVAIDFDFSGIPAERLSLIGGYDSPIPFPTLFTGMIFIQMFYWSTNQTITQRAMASPTVKEAQKGILAAAAIRLLIVPPIIVLPGIISYKLYGEVGNNKAFGMIVSELLPVALTGAFAAAMAAAVLTTFNSILNASAALWVCDVHQTYISKKPNVRRVSLIVSVVMVLLAFFMFPVFLNAKNLINLMQELYGFLSMPILSAFIVGLLFKNVDARAVIISVVLGVLLYAFFTRVWPMLPGGNYIHMMAITLLFSVLTALVMNKVIYKKKSEWDAHNVFGRNASKVTL
ncbi:MAG: SSS family solute:Na+ symporter [Saprospiraceae bacterium]|jgi:SSS family solute:Na+ symporter